MTRTSLSSQGRILCVDDDGIQLKLLIRGFRPHGFEVVTGTDGIQHYKHGEIIWSFIWRRRHASKVASHRAVA